MANYKVHTKIGAILEFGADGYAILPVSDTNNASKAFPEILLYAGTPPDNTTPIARLNANEIVGIEQIS